MILVTGGLGFIGAHTAVTLIDNNFEVLIVDDLSNTSIDVLDGIEKACGKRPHFEQIDLKDKTKVAEVFKTYSIEGIIHFAAFKAVGESVEKPLEYYDNNLSSLVNLLAVAQDQNRRVPFIFSSSCTVYGEPETLPITENEASKPALSPYGNTKQICEEILSDLTKVNENIPVIALRYFNPIGAHASAEIGELPLGIPQNLVPFITQSAAGIRGPITVFGNDYPTKDGTCIRDYIHVEDLAEAHMAALKHLHSVSGVKTYDVLNVGTGTGNSVLDIIRTFEKVTNVALNYKIGKRRSGDVVETYADTTKINSVLGWKSSKTLEDALRSAWNWEKKLRGIS
jgi:UDP-glucose 4-epimerase